MKAWFLSTAVIKKMPESHLEEILTNVDEDGNIWQSIVIDLRYIKY